MSKIAFSYWITIRAAMWYLCHSFALALHFIVKGLWWNKLVSLEFQNSLFFLTPLSNSIPFRVILCFPLPYLSPFFFLQLPLKQWRRNQFTLSLRFLVKKKNANSWETDSMMLLRKWQEISTAESDNQEWMINEDFQFKMVTFFQLLKLLNSLVH